VVGEGEIEEVECASWRESVVVLGNRQLSGGVRGVAEG